MRFLDRLFERRNERWRLSQLKAWSDLGLGYGPTAAGVEVTPERAVSLPAVFASIAVLSQDVGKTPIKLRRQIGPDTFQDATDHPLYEILHALPNPETTAFDLKREMMADLLTHERAYAQIVRVDGRVVALWRLDPTRVHVDRDEQRRKRYRVTLPNGQFETFTFDASQPPILDLRHPSPIRHCRDLIGTALALQIYTGRFFSNGARVGGVLQTDGTLGPEQANRLRDSFAAYQQGAENAHRIAVLEQGLKYTPIAAQNDEAQLNETSQTLRTEIASAFRLPPWKIGIMDSANYSNMEAGEQSYVNSTLDPFFVAWELALRRDVLTSRQYGQFDITFDRSALIRNDIKSLHEALARGRDSGYYSVNDVRRKLGENPISAELGGDTYAANANLVPINQQRTTTP